MELRGWAVRDGLAYLTASLCLGWVAVWAGENLFWTTPAPDMNAGVLLMTWGLYSVAAAAALSGTLWSGISGWRAAFLGGALLGFVIEGVLVGTMYDAFPAQLVWTPLAWHALISGLVVLAGGFALARGSVWRQVVGCLSLGIFGAIWGLYWPLEGKALADVPAMLLYLGLVGAGAALALGVLSRLARLSWGRWWVWLAPVAMAAVWVVDTVMAPHPVRLAGPALMLVTLWTMRRLGRAGEGLDFGPPLDWGRSLLNAGAAFITALMVVPGWAYFGGVAVNIPVALTTGAISLALWLWLVIRAVVARR